MIKNKTHSVFQDEAGMKLNMNDSVSTARSKVEDSNM